MPVLVLIELLTLAGAVLYCFLILSFPFGAPGYLVTPTPIEETLEVAINDTGPVYTKNEYSDWVSISISGSIEGNGEFFHDAFYHYNDATQGAQSEFDGFLIDGISASHGHGRPDYRYDHTYRFSYALNGYARSNSTDSPKTIGFQVINETVSGLEREFIIEVSSDSYKHKPDARGR